MSSLAVCAFVVCSWVAFPPAASQPAASPPAPSPAATYLAEARSIQSALSELEAAFELRVEVELLRERNFRELQSDYETLRAGVSVLRQRMSQITPPDLPGAQQLKWGLESLVTQEGASMLREYGPIPAAFDRRTLAEPAVAQRYQRTIQGQRLRTSRAVAHFEEEVARFAKANQLPYTTNSDLGNYLQHMYRVHEEEAAVAQAYHAELERVLAGAAPDRLPDLRLAWKVTVARLQEALRSEPPPVNRAAEEVGKKLRPRFQYQAQRIDKEYVEVEQVAIDPAQTAPQKAARLQAPLKLLRTLEAAERQACVTALESYAKTENLTYVRPAPMVPDPAQFKKFNTEIVSINARLSVAGARFSAAFSEARQSGASAGLRKKHKGLLLAFGAIDAESKGLQVPPSEAARELYQAHRKYMAGQAAMIKEEFSRVVDVLEHPQLSKEEKMSQLQAIFARLVQQEQAEFAPLQASQKAFAAEHGIEFD